jgi:hypothetical protein
MREQHPVFDAEISRDSAVWRYFDLPRFLSFLQNRALYFCRADLLGDPLEGSFTRATAAEREKLVSNPPDGMTREEVESVIRRNSSIIGSFPRQVYINCWHVGSHESMAMWRGYGSGPCGIAIRSTFGVLDDTLPEKFAGSGREESIYLGPVRYLDYSSITARVPHENNVYGPFVCKSLAYVHESEVRAVFADLLALGDIGEGGPTGHFVDLDLSELVQAVIISPLAPRWFEGLVRSTCVRFGFDFEVTTSSVAAPPIY